MACIVTNHFKNANEKIRKVEFTYIFKEMIEQLENDTRTDLNITTN